MVVQPGHAEHRLRDLGHAQENIPQWNDRPVSEHAHEIVGARQMVVVESGVRETKRRRIRVSHRRGQQCIVASRAGVLGRFVF